MLTKVLTLRIFVLLFNFFLGVRYLFQYLRTVFFSSVAVIYRTLILSNKSLQVVVTYDDTLIYCTTVSLDMSSNHYKQ